MGLILLPTFVLCLLLWLSVIAVFISSYTKATDKRRFLRDVATSALFALILTFLGTTASYVGQHKAYAVNTYLFVALGPPTWLLLVAYSVLKHLAATKESQSETYRAYASGVFLAVPALVLVFLFNLDRIMSLLNVELYTH